MEQFEGMNLAMISSLKLAAMADVESIPATPSFAFSGIVLKSGKTWAELKFTPGTANFGEIEKTENGGNFWEKEVNFSIPKLRNEISEEIRNFENRRLYALVTDMNGTSFLVFPVRMARVKQVTGQPDGSNAYRVQLTGRHTSESPFVTETEAGSGSGGLGV